MWSAYNAQAEKSLFNLIGNREPWMVIEQDVRVGR